jgi:DnaK suppressor protein
MTARSGRAKTGGGRKPARASASKAGARAHAKVSQPASPKKKPGKPGPAAKTVPVAKRSAVQKARATAVKEVRKPEPRAKSPVKGPTKVVAKALTGAAAKTAKKRPRRAEFERYRNLLLDRQRELTQAYQTSKRDSRSTGSDSGTEDYIDYAVSSYTKEFLLSLTEMDRKQLLLVEEALKRIDRREFGLCQQCSEAISPKRLEVAPWARYCVRCQELEEQGLLPQYVFPPVSGEDVEDVEEEDIDSIEGRFDEKLDAEEEEEDVSLDGTLIEQSDEGESGSED